MISLLTVVRHHLSAHTCFFVCCRPDPAVVFGTSDMEARHPEKHWCSDWKPGRRTGARGQPSVRNWGEHPDWYQRAFTPHDEAVPRQPPTPRVRFSRLFCLRVGVGSYNVVASHQPSCSHIPAACLRADSRKQMPRCGSAGTVIDADRFLSLLLCHFSCIVSLFPLRRYLVPTGITQPTLKGSDWRHGVVYWPGMVAGAIGRRGLDSDEPFAGTLRKSPYGSRTFHEEAERAKMRRTRKKPHKNPWRREATTAKAGSSRSSGDDSSEESDAGSDASVPAGVDFWWSDDEEELPMTTSGVDSMAFADIFPGMSIADAVLDVVCRAVALSGRLSGDNRAVQAETVAHEAEGVAADADALITRYVAVLFGPLNTPKAHLVANHLLAEIMDRGNLTEADTSINEGLHSKCKAMYDRTNKNVDTFTVQMLRHEQTLAAILADAPEPLEAPTQAKNPRKRKRAVGATPAEDAERRAMGAEIPVNRVRGRRVAVADLSSATDGRLFGLAAVLGVSGNSSLAVQNSLLFPAIFEWGAPSEYMRVHADPSNRQKPYYDSVRCRDATAPGGFFWSRCLLAYDGVDGAPGSGIIVQKMVVDETVDATTCVRTRHGDTRLRWDLDPSTGFPRLANVVIENVLRLEQIEPDFASLCARHGLFATPANSPDTRAEREAERFFVNSHYPWTSAKLKEH